MDETTFRILETLTREIGRETSINALTEKIARLHGSAYYVNIYQRLQKMARERLVTLTKVGNASIVALNFKEYLLVDLLTEVEIRKKHDLLKRNVELQMLFAELETYCRDKIFVRSISAIKPEKNAKLNRAELLILLRAQGTSFYPDAEEIDALHGVMHQLQKARSMKVDFLILPDTKMLDMLTTDEANPVKEMLADKVTFYGPQNFWNVIKAAAERDIQLRIEERETNPSKIGEHDLAYNLARFGYKEIGREITYGRDICLEYIVTALLMQGDARMIDAIPVILAKNSANYELLLFLSQKYRLSERLLGLLVVLAEVTPRDDLQSVIGYMKAMKIKEITADKKSIMEKMRLYNAA